MQLFSRSLAALAVLLIAGFVFMAVSTQNGVEIFPNLSVISTPGTGEDNYFATVAGSGSTCSSWASGCTFRTAVAKCTGTKQCNVYLGAGVHDTNNGSDANGTTIAVDYVRIIGFGEPDEIGQSSQLANKRAAGATYNLQVTGSRFSVNHVAFDNSAQADKTVVHLHLQGSYNTVRDCVFRQATADGANTGILIANSSVSHTIEGNRFRRLEGSGIEFGQSSRYYVNKNVFWSCTKGLYASNANADGGIFRENKYMACTTAVDIAAAAAKTWYSLNAFYANNTTNFGAFSSYGGTVFIEAPTASGRNRSVYPLAAAGATLSKDANAYVWGEIQQIIPTATINQPIIIQSINVQAWSDPQIYKIELYYGDVAGTISAGVYEILLGATATPNRVSVPVFLNLAIPARAYVGARIMTSTAGVDTVTLSLGYLAL